MRKELKYHEELLELIRVMTVYDLSIGTTKRYNEIPMRQKGGSSRPPINLRLFDFRERKLRQIRRIAEEMWDEIEKET